MSKGILNCPLCGEVLGAEHDERSGQCSGTLLAELIERGERLILDDMAAGSFSTSVQNLDELQNYADVAGYGLFDNDTRPLSERECVAILDALDAWLESGDAYRQAGLEDRK